MRPIATYSRQLPVGPDRIWENVLDWEHLPWLHADTFGHVRLLERRADGWRAETSLRGADAPFVVDVSIDRAAAEYHSRTVAGPGTGADVVTRLTPLDARRTRVDVAFLVPDLPPGAADAVGAMWVATYTRLWDEDEAMMVRRQDLLDGTLAAGRLDGGFSDVCPHLGGPLACRDGAVVCPWHGYRFDARTGQSLDGCAPSLERA